MEESLFNSLKMLIRFWDCSSEPWGVKDSQSRYIYANKILYRLLALPDKFSMEGKTDGELPNPIAEFELDFQEHDSKVKLLQDRITSVEIHAWDGRSYYQPYFFDKYPLIDGHGVSQGVICHGRPVEDVMLTHLNKIKVPISLILTPPSDLFSKREWEVLFYILHSFSSMEIAKKLHLSSMTIDNVTQKIYKKIGGGSRHQLMDYCYENKIKNYIPQTFFEYSGSFPLI